MTAPYPAPAAPRQAAESLSPQLIALSPHVIGGPFAVGAAEITIGRSEGCTIIVARELVSRTHARVARIGDRYLLVDAGSVNGTFLNGQRIMSAQSLRSGDRIGLSDAEPLLQFVDPDGTRARADALRFDLEMQRFFYQGHTLQLGSNEFRLLLHLNANAGRICTRESCVYAVWHTQKGVEGYRNALDQHIYQIRAKLQAVDPRANPILTVRGEGYMLEV